MPVATKKPKKKASPAAKTFTVVRQDWVESERGWGVRPDGYTLHLSMEDHAAFVKGYYETHNNEAVVPDEYTRTSGQPKPVTVDAATIKELEKHKKIVRAEPHTYGKYGIWRYR